MSHPSAVSPPVLRAAAVAASMQSAVIVTRHFTHQYRGFFHRVGPGRRHPADAIGVVNAYYITVVALLMSLAALVDIYG